MRFWRWKCTNEQCAHVLSLLASKLPEPCRKCACEIHLKVGESETKWGEVRTCPNR
jgi:hypothetical protein